GSESGGCSMANSRAKHRSKQETVRCMNSQPRGIRNSEAHLYIGVGRRVFDREFRPYLHVIEFGHSTKIVDRLELDALFDEYRQRNGRLSSGARKCQNERQDYINGGRET